MIWIELQQMFWLSRYKSSLPRKYFQVCFCSEECKSKALHQGWPMLEFITSYLKHRELCEILGASRTPAFSKNPWNASWADIYGNRGLRAGQLYRAGMIRFPLQQSFSIEIRLPPPEIATNSQQYSFREYVRESVAEFLGGSSKEAEVKSF